MLKKIIEKLKKEFRGLGPGFVTGAADDDPSGIATYSIAGAQFGYKLTWMALFLTPLMNAVQEMCGRIGMVSGMGLSGVIKKYYSKKLLYFTIFLLFISNTVNIGADLGVMAASLQLIFGLPFIFWLILITIFTLALEIYVPYDRYSRFLKWMGLTLLVYCITALLTPQNWPEIARYFFIPHIDFDLNYLMAMVGFAGTTISPYLFYWQSSVMVEEAIKEGKIKEFEQSPHVVNSEIKTMQKDTGIGMF
jgi:NRAMP (natural resistance-associated macrophage protein)-like metal ion transporter